MSVSWWSGSGGTRVAERAVSFPVGSNILEESGALPATQKLDSGDFHTSKGR